MRRPLHLLAAAILAFNALQTALGDFLNPSDLNAAGLKTYWQLQIPLDDGQAATNVYLVDDQLYVVTGDGFAYAIHAHTGAMRWMQQVTRGGYQLTRPCHAADRAIFITPAAITQYHRVYGDPIYQYPLRWPAGTGGVADGDQFYFGALNGRFFAHHVNLPFDIWRAGTKARITSTPALYGGDLYVASEDKNVYACRAADKRYRWIAPTSGAITADLVANEEGVFVASADHRLYLFDRAYGGMKWRVQLSGPLKEAPVVAGNVAYQYSPKDGVVAIETGINVDERVRWTAPTGRKLLTVHGEHAYLLSVDQSILALKTKDGSQTADIPAAGFSMPAPSPDNASLILGSADGRLVCLRPLDAPPIDAQAVREALSARARPAKAEEERAAAAETPAEPEIDVLSAYSNAPLGGKSRVSKNFGRGGSGGVAPLTPTTPSNPEPAPSPSEDEKEEKEDDNP